MRAALLLLALCELHGAAGRDVDELHWAAGLFAETEDFCDGFDFHDGRARLAVREIVHAALGAEALDVARYELIVLGVRGERQPRLLRLLKRAHELEVVRARQPLELLVASFGRFVKERLIGDDALVRKRLYLLGELAARRTEEAEVHAAALLAEIDAVVQNLRVVLRGD